MTTELANLIREAMDLPDGSTSAGGPPLLADDAPVPEADALGGGDDSFYIVGLIGGKDVGKSTLVNALVGQAITVPTAFGRGTRQAIAYAHERQVGRLRTLLDREAPGAYQIIPHTISRLSRQVLLDLPDIDSRWLEHLQLTRRMLRHMLFPVWMQSIEKYADAQPQRLLQQVAEGNDPANFVFCLNKADQLSDSERIELRDDYARRIAVVLRLDLPPQVCVIAATEPDRFDLPSLRERLSRQKTPEDLADSQQAAVKQQDRSLLRWLDAQHFEERANRLERLLESAEELVAARLAAPLLERSVPRIMEDPAHRLALADAVAETRVSRWPIVNMLHTALSPLLAVVRINLGPGGATPLAAAEGLVQSHLQIDTQPVAQHVAATFAQIHQTHPGSAKLFGARRLWESVWAEQSAAELRSNLAGTIDRQRKAVCSRLASPAVWLYPIRWILTIGVVLWFPIVQPILEAFLQDSTARTARDIVLLAVRMFGVTYLLSSVAFLAIYFVVLWIMLRWDTQRRVARLLLRWQAAGGVDADLSLAHTTMDWCDRLLDSLRDNVKRVRAVSDRIKSYKHDSGLSAA